MVLATIGFHGTMIVRTSERSECWHLQMSGDLPGMEAPGNRIQLAHFFDAKQSSNVFSLVSTHPQEYHMRYSSQGSKKLAETATSLYSLKGTQLFKKTESCLRVETQPTVPV